MSGAKTKIVLVTLMASAKGKKRRKIDKGMERKDTLKR